MNSSKLTDREKLEYAEYFDYPQQTWWNQSIWPTVLTWILTPFFAAIYVLVYIVFGFFSLFPNVRSSEIDTDDN